MLVNIRNILSLLLSLLIVQVAAIKSPLPDTRTLVLYDSKSTPKFIETHSKLLSLLDSNELGLVIRDINAKEQERPIELFKNGYRLYQNVLFFPSKAKEISSEISNSQLVEFAQDGGDFLIVSNQDGTQTDLTLYLNELGIYPSPKGYKLIDYHQTSPSDNSNAVESIESPEFLNNVIIPDSIKLAELKYEHGSAALLSNSEFLIPILKASRSSITFAVDEGVINSESTWHSGSQGFLVVGFQALNNARTTWIGSESIFTDESFEAEIVGSLINWTFQITGLIKTTFVNHYKIVDGEIVANDTNYKIKDTSRFEIGVSKWDGSNWVPFTDCTDMQLEFVMLDPYHRLNLVNSGESGESSIYSTEFDIPDQHGMFTYKLDYKRPGLSFVSEEVVVPVRHLANDEYPRSWEIPNSWVYLSSAMAVIGAWFMFVVIYVVSGKEPVTEGKKTN